MKNKLVSIMIVTALMVSMISGCSSGNTNNETAGTQQTSSENNTTTAAGGNDAKAASLIDKKVGICIYQFDDDFMSLFRNELKSYMVAQGFSADNVSIVDSEGNQAVQTAQIQDFIKNGVDVLIVNPVSTSSASDITDLVVGANIPLVYINREPDNKEEQRWRDNNWKVCYVGCDARQSGTYQGEIISDLGMDTIDMNKNGKVDYIMIQGDPENIDAQYRTDFSIKALQDAGMDVNCLTSGVGNWDKQQAKNLVADALEAHPETEVVFCNNDAMALGALESIEDAGRTVGTDIYLVGVDALVEALEDVIDGKMTGTVFNDHFSQAHSAADAAINYIKGQSNENYIGCDYVKITSDNAQKILDAVK
ncbi:substrate-binding domain-containing protein [Butyrivibrio sp. INlla16]|uniref:substrate-binding domain-containing protein n=1 Tax=Butyrivibrio sp. INlla16 TaxID=1520807 RepID=UPI00088444AC|nr:substrate-binding domain-containing protein [Butyrivibrio sp. INlla16]SDB19210.1 methyl-galactoside transport system substrate-binding protein [Butyrivibrio sp. INlla16]